MKNEPNQPKRSFSLTGVILILIGALLLAGNLNLIPENLWHLIAQWPTIFAAIAIINFANRKMVPGIIFTALWLFFVFPDLFPSLPPGTMQKFWPVLLILGGILIINTHRRINLKTKKWENTSSSDIINEVAIFGGSVKHIKSNNFRGGEITSIFGGSEIYFKDCQLAPEGATIEMTNIFGGSKLIVPKNWNVKIEAVSILGGFSDKRIEFPSSEENSQTLTIKGVVIFGGGEIASY